MDYKGPALLRDLYNFPRFNNGLISHSAMEVCCEPTELFGVIVMKFRGMVNLTILQAGNLNNS